MHQMLVKTSFLRVYIPEDLATLSVASLPEARTRAGHGLKVDRFGLTEEPMADDVLTAEYGGQLYRCPRHPRLRLLEGVLAFHNAYADIGANVLVPESVARRAAEELASLHDHEPEQRSHILSSTWHVPLRWFVAFAPEERELMDSADGPTVRYRTLRGEASARLRTALGVLAEVGMEDGVVADLREYDEWLEGFPASSLVELDYGSVAQMFRPADLILDDSASELWESIEHLANDNYEEAGEMYARTATRWAPAMAVTYSN